LERLVHWYDSQQGWWMPLKQATEDRYLARGQ
jgi:dTDP-D-glucose 4,6-dehydratase